MKRIYSIVVVLMLAVSLYSPFSDSANAKSVSENLLALSKTDSNFSDDERVIFGLINRERIKRKLNSLDWRDDLAKMARKYAEKMARENFFSHYEKNGADVAKRAIEAKINDWDGIGENLFYVEGKDDFDKFAVEKWMQSPGHRENILNANWTTAGLGIARSKNGRVYIVQVFIAEK